VDFCCPPIAAPFPRPISLPQSGYDSVSPSYFGSNHVLVARPSTKNTPAPFLFFHADYIFFALNLPFFKAAVPARLNCPQLLAFFFTAFSNQSSPRAFSTAPLLVFSDHNIPPQTAPEICCFSSLIARSTRLNYLNPRSPRCFTPPPPPQPFQLWSFSPPIGCLYFGPMDPSLPFFFNFFTFCVFR